MLRSTDDIKYKDNDSQVVLADFGLAKKVLIPNSLTTKCGTAGYAAPEIIDVSCITPSNVEEGAGYDVGVDIWAMGGFLVLFVDRFLRHWIDIAFCRSAHNDSFRLFI